MGAVDLVQTLIAEGVEFATDGERVRWRNSGGRMTPETVAQLAAAKTEVIGFLHRNESRAKHGPAVESRDTQSEAAEFHGNSGHPDLDAFEERAAIAEFDGGLSRSDAEQLAALCQGFENVVEFESALRARAKKADICVK